MKPVFSRRPRTRAKMFPKYATNIEGTAGLVVSNKQIVKARRTRRIVQTISEHEQTQNIQRRQPLTNAHSQLIQEGVIKPKRYELRSLRITQETPRQRIYVFSKNPTLQELEIHLSGINLPKKRKALIEQFLAKNKIKDQRAFHAQLIQAVRELRTNLEKTELISSINHSIGIDAFAVEVNKHIADHIMVSLKPKPVRGRHQFEPEKDNVFVFSLIGEKELLTRFEK
ncbi:MAG: hypothetical protein Q7S92_04950 [Candidatus Diapherotrites archaeon]|nr:hypothetical protein [Candidatus Diapherotrites archaeon]